MKTRLAFYKAKNGDIFDKLIAWWTRSPYSHCEIVIGNKWYSSSPRDGRVRKAIIEPNPDSWDYIDVPMNTMDEVLVETLFKKYDGAKYDFMGILLSQILPLGMHSKSKWFCSEICAYVLQNVDKLPYGKEPNWYSPGRLYSRLSEIRDTVEGKR
jgi:hypothetical protein